MGGIGCAGVALALKAFTLKLPQPGPASLGRGTRRRQAARPQPVNHQAKLNRRGTLAGRAFNPVPKFNHGPFKLLVDSESRNHGPKFRTFDLNI